MSVVPLHLTVLSQRQGGGLLKRGAGVTGDENQRDDKRVSSVETCYAPQHQRRLPFVLLSQTAEP